MMKFKMSSVLEQLCCRFALEQRFEFKPVVSPAL